MKNCKTARIQISVLSLILFIFLSLNILGQKDFKKYGFESAYAKKTSTTKMAGVETETIQEIYIADYGRLMATYTTEKRNITMANMVEVEKSVTIVDGVWFTRYNPETRTGTKTKIDMAEKFSNMSEGDMQKMAEQMEQATGTETEDIGTKVIAGQTCTGTRATTNMMGMKNISEIWMYEDFIMESNSNSSGSGVDVKEKVEEFILDADYDKKKLKVPDNVKITESRFKY
jgi:hypothetical protein